MVVLALPLNREQLPSSHDVEQGIPLNQSVANEDNHENTNSHDSVQVNQFSNLQTSEYCDNTNLYNGTEMSQFSNLEANTYSDNTNVAGHLSRTQAYRYAAEYHEREKQLCYNIKMIYYTIAIVFIILIIALLRARDNSRSHRHRYG